MQNDVLQIAHRGYIKIENTVDGIVQASKVVSIVECDVRFNTNREIILCHDREDRNFKKNETLEDLCKLSESMSLMIDIKAFGILPSIEIADSVQSIIIKYPQHKYYMCSFNEFCVKRLLELRQSTNISQKIGIISSGIPISMFEHLDGVDFVSLDYNSVCEEIVELLHKNKKQVFTWTVNSLEMQKYVTAVCRVDGIIYDLL